MPRWAGCNFHLGWIQDSLVTPDGWVVYPFLESALKVRYGFGTASKPHLLAQVIPALPADAALAAWDPNFEGHAVAQPEARNLWPNGDDGP